MPRDVKKNRDVISNTTGKSLTHQSERTRTDINLMLKKGTVLPMDPQQMTFGDFTDGADFQSVQDRIVAVNEQFDTLPSETREAFRNDPANMLDFISDEKNRDEAIKMGLIAVDKHPDPDPDPDVSRKYSTDNAGPKDAKTTESTDTSDD